MYPPGKGSPSIAGSLKPLTPYLVSGRVRPRDKYALIDWSALSCNGRLLVESTCGIDRYFRPRSLDSSHNFLLQLLARSSGLEGGLVVVLPFTWSFSSRNVCNITRYGGGAHPQNE